MMELARALTSTVGRLVVDRTGLSARYAITLEFAPDPMAVNSDRPTIFTAVQEQLGLRLESTREPVEVLVIDHAEQPTPD